MTSKNQAKPKKQSRQAKPRSSSDSGKSQIDSAESEANELLRKLAEARQAKPQSQPTREEAEYAAKKKRAAEVSAKLIKAGQEIGRIPPIADPERRTAALKSLKQYCETYFPAKFYLEWSADQLKAIDRIEECILRGGLFALAMPRGSGKTELCKRGAEWAILNGFRKLILIVGATDELAETIMRDIKNALSQNELLAADFPEVCYPIWALDGEGRRCLGQRYNGKRTGIVWKDDRIRMPDIPGSRASGSHIFTRGITGAIRGLAVTGPNGETVRPDLIFPDDVQTRASAASITQTASREQTISGDMMELAGPDKKIAAVMPCTMIYQGDLAARFLDRSVHPEFRGETFKAIYQFPINGELWEQYAEIRRDSMRNGGDGRQATEFYAANRNAMDAGAIVAWTGRQKPGDISALQTAMNVKIEKPETFAAEWQNDPLPPFAGLVDELTQSQIVSKATNIDHGIVPRECTRLTAFIDVGKGLLWYAVCAWDERFGGSLIDYGTFPRQNRRSFMKADARPSLADTYPGMTETAAIHAGLTVLASVLLDKRWVQDGSREEFQIGQLLVDSGHQAETIFKWARESGRSANVLPAKGYGVTCKKKPMHEWPAKAGERKGFNWKLYPPASGKGRWAIVDTNSWKNFIADRIRVPPGTRGSFGLFGSSAAVENGLHEMMIHHITSEYRTLVSANGRSCYEWQQIVGRDNDYFDCLVGCAVAASVAGLQWTPDAEAPPNQQRRMSNSEKFERAQRAQTKT